jgi:hypothetical protein
MYCPKCGAENLDGARFCRNCGEALRATSPSNNRGMAPVGNAGTAATSGSGVVGIIKGNLSTTSAKVELALRIAIVIALLMPCVSSPLIYRSVNRIDSLGSYLTGSIGYDFSDDTGSSVYGILGKEAWTMPEFNEIASDIDMARKTINDYASYYSSSESGAVTLNLDTSVSTVALMQLAYPIWVILLICMIARLAFGLFVPSPETKCGRTRKVAVFDAIGMVITAALTAYWCYEVMSLNSSFMSRIDSIQYGTSASIGNLYQLTAWPWVIIALCLVVAFWHWLAPALGLKR